MQHECAGIIPYTIQQYDNLLLIAQKFNTTVYAIAAINPGVDLNYIQMGQVISIPCNFNLYPAMPYNVTEIIPVFSKVQIDLNKELRMLWEENIMWMRIAVIENTEKLSSNDKSHKRFIRNADDFAQLLKQYYGEQDSAKFANLFKNLLNNETFDDSKIDDIAIFLSNINPFWLLSSWKIMLSNFIKMVNKQIKYIHKRDYLSSINSFDEIERYALMMADEMTEGIIKQFPDKF